MTDSDAIKAFTDMLKSGDHEGAAALFNAENIVSLEPMPGPMEECRGRDAVKAKSDWWYANHTIHSATSEGPLVNGNQFLMTFKMDLTMNATGQRMQMEEFGLYTIANGKIIEERFFYPTA